METYNPDSAILSASLEELKAIASWSQSRSPSHPDQRLVLVGGWAVHAYNNYFGSIDIDLVASSELKASLMYHLRKERGFTHYGEEGDRSVSRVTPAGEIIIDFLLDSPDAPFKGRRETLGFDKLRDRTVIRPISQDLSFKMPERSLLLLYKLKASWDRTYSLSHEKLPNPVYTEGKIIKDGSDILALIDQNYGGQELDLGYLGKQLSGLGFLKEHFRTIPDNSESVKKYGKMDKKAARLICDQLLSLI